MLLVELCCLFPGELVLLLCQDIYPVSSDMFQYLLHLPLLHCIRLYHHHSKLLVTRL